MSFSLEDLKKATNRNGLVPSRGNNGLANLKGNLAVNKGDLDSRIKSLSAQVLPQAASILKEGSAELVFLFDCSESCSGTEQVTMKGFNELIEKEKRVGFPTIVSTILFNSTDHVVNDRVDINRVGSLNYVAKGGTALYDTLCKHLQNIMQKQAMSGSKALKKTVVVIMTDGKDESSIFNDGRDAKQKVAECLALGWEFIFLGANINAKMVAASLGINANYAENYMVTETGILTNFQAVRKALQSVREEGKINPDWSTSIQNNNLAIEMKNSHEDNGPVLKLGGK